MQPRPLPSSRGTRPPSAWIALTLAATLLVAASVVGLYVAQDRMLASATALVRDLRQGRIDLYEGFMHAVLARGEDSPWDRGRGLVLMEQGVSEVQAVLGRIDEPAGRRLGQELGQFVSVLHRPGPPDARTALELRVAFYDLDLAAQRVDRVLREQLNAMRRTLAIVFWAVLCVSSVLLTLVSVGAVRSGRREAAAVAGRRESEMRFRQLAEGIREVFWLSDLDTRRMLYVNPAYESVWGRPVASLLEQPLSWLDAVHPDDRERVRARLPAQALGEYEEDYRVRRPDGSERWIRDRAFPVRDDDGRVYRVAGIAQDITERRRAEARLADSEARFRLLFDHSPQPIVVHAGGVIELANAAALATLGVAHMRDIVGRPLVDFVDPSRRSQSLDMLERLSAAPGVEPIATIRGRRADGTALRLEVTTASYRQGSRMLMLTAMRDVTERRVARMALRESARRLRDVIDLVPHAIYAKDLDGRYLLANRTTARYLGREPHELLGRRPDELGLDPAGAERDREVDREVLRTQHRRDGEVVRRFHGEDIAFAYSKIAFSFGGSAADAVLGVSTDISELKRAEAQLKESVALLQATLQATDNGVLVTGPDGGLLLWNQRMVALLGGAGPLQEGDKTAVLAALGSHPPGAEVAGTVQQIGQRADGRYIESHAQPMLIDGARAGRVWTFRDVTAREQALADAQAREQELEARVKERTRAMAQAYAELQSFSDAVSHDLRAPLTAIDAFAQVLVRKHQDRLEPQARAYVERILDASANMRAMIHGLLELSRHARAPVHRRPLDLGAMAREAYEVQASALGDRRVEFEVDDDLLASGDPVLVATLLQNLVGNALKYSRERDPARIRVGRGSADGDACFFVRDNGAGFEPAYADRLFKPFSRLHDDRVFEGHGIGLATASRIVARHGGRIWADGAPGEGATFCFTLE